MAKTTKVKTGGKGGTTKGSPRQRPNTTTKTTKKK